MGTDKEKAVKNLKMEIQIKLYKERIDFFSRSRARQVLTGLEKFKTIILDFDKVPTVGQAFADEIFRVFQLKHPEIKIKPINMNESVAFMVGRVEKRIITSKPRTRVEDSQVRIENTQI